MEIKTIVAGRFMLDRRVDTQQQRAVLKDFEETMLTDAHPVGFFEYKFSVFNLQLDKATIDDFISRNKNALRYFRVAICSEGDIDVCMYDGDEIHWQ